MATSAVVPTLSPSMDIQVSSNFERLLFELNDRDGGLTAEQLQRFRDHRPAEVEPDQLDTFVDGVRRRPHRRRGDARGSSRGTYADTGDADRPPHRGRLGAARAGRRPLRRPDGDVGHRPSGKFPDAVERATGVRPALPTHLADLLDRPERTVHLPNDLAAVEAFVARA